MDNPQAFPTGGETKDCGVCGMGVYVPAPGMTLLDYFAVHSDQPGVSEIVAMAGHKTDGFRVYIDGSDTGPTFNEWWNDLPLDERFKLSADVRFAMARAMLTARQENSNGH